MAQVLYTVADAMRASDITEAGLYMGETPAERIADQMYDNDFSSYMEKTTQDINDDLKLFSELPATGGRLRLSPAQRTNLHAFTQWVKEQFLLMGNDPATIEISVDEAIEHIKRRQTMKVFRERLKQ